MNVGHVALPAELSELSFRKERDHHVEAVVVYETCVDKETPKLSVFATDYAYVDEETSKVSRFVKDYIWRAFVDNETPKVSKSAKDHI